MICVLHIVCMCERDTTYEVTNMAAITVLVTSQLSWAPPTALLTEETSPHLKAA